MRTFELRPACLFLVVEGIRAFTVNDTITESGELLEEGDEELVVYYTDGTVLSWTLYADEATAAYEGLRRELGMITS